jgi:hypothetical protein
VTSSFAKGNKRKEQEVLTVATGAICGNIGPLSLDLRLKLVDWRGTNGLLVPVIATALKEHLE